MLMLLGNAYQRESQVEFFKSPLNELINIGVILIVRHDLGFEEQVVKEDYRTPAFRRCVSGARHRIAVETHQT